MRLKLCISSGVGNCPSAVTPPEDTAAAGAWGSVTTEDLLSAATEARFSSTISAWRPAAATVSPIASPVGAIVEDLLICDGPQRNGII
ncbi:unnamed protein product [Fusarium graminearum]|nr:unnamed protein product [Fusarium graminearum]CAG1972550.1 unnamed protein product [Fusarium graminearum]VTO94084.1 unnamed protein product [Fusarium graminearum]